MNHPARRTAVAAGLIGIVSAIALLSLATGLHLTSSGPTVRAQTVVPSIFCVTTTVFLASESDDDVAWLGISTEDDKTLSAVAASSPAAAAGLRRGDVVEAVDGAPVASVSDVVRAIHKHRPGDLCTLSVIRKGVHLKLRAVLGKLS